MASLTFFVLPLIYTMAFVAPATVPRWILLAVVLPFLIAHRNLRTWWPHAIGAALLAWAAITMIWALSWSDGVARLFEMGIAGLAFCLGSSLTPGECRAVLTAFGLGMAINGVMAGANIFGWQPVFSASDVGALFVNGNFLAEAAVIGAVAMLALRRWWIAALIAPAALLPLSRSAYVSLGILAVMWLWRRSRLAAGGVAVAGVLAAGAYIATIPGGAAYPGTGFDSIKLAPRVALYANTAHGIMVNPLGQGVGSFWAAYPLYHDAVVPTPDTTYRFNVRPQTAHNDALTLGLELGVVGLFLAVVFFADVLIRRRDGPEASACRWAVIAFLLLGLWGFPAYAPVPLAVTLLAAGYLCARPEPEKEWTFLSHG